MDTNPFSTDFPQPLLQGFQLLYAVSGEPLEQEEVVQVVARLPFCLYIPPCRYLFTYPGTSEFIGFVPEKVWTSHAEGSTEIKEELVVPDKTVYLNKPEIITEWIGTPEASVQGPQGHNVEFDKDPTGYFRFSRLTVEIDWKFPRDFNPYNNDDSNRSSAIEEVPSRILDIANYVIDLYRVVTGDGYIRRVSYIAIEDIRIGIPDNCSIRQQEKFTGDKFTYKCGYHPYLFSAHGIRPAIVNKPGKTIEAFQTSLKQPVRPEAYRLLELNAEQALDQRDVKVAVLESFTSLEVYVEQFYFRKLGDRMSEADIENLLSSSDNWRLKVRLKKLLKKYCSISIAEMDGELWQKWLRAHDKRSKLIHRNIEPSLEEAKKIVERNKAIIQLLGTL
jgi:hypothetical protein